MLFHLAIACQADPAPESSGSIAQAGMTTVCDLTLSTVGSDEAQFTQISSLDVDSRGQIYVADTGGLPRIVVLSASGDVVRQIGRRGEGPSEFQDPRQVQVYAGDSLMVFDAGLNRLTFFAPNSDSVTNTINLTNETPFGLPPAYVARTKQGNLLVVTFRYFTASYRPGTDPPRRRAVSLLRPDGSMLRDSIIVFPQSTEFISGHLTRLPGVVFSLSNPAGRLREMVLGPRDRIYYGGGDSLSIEVYSLLGKPLERFSADFEATPFSEADLDSLLGTRSTSMREAIRAQAPATWPAFRRFVVDDQERVWVGVLDPRGERTRWTVFDSDGRVSCVVPLQDNVRIRAVKGSNVYATRIGPLEIPKVVVYRLQE